MDQDAIDSFRRARMQALAEKFGGKSELGRRLKYRDGAFVGQMISGRRAITEKTVRQAEGLPGCKGWFDIVRQTEPSSLQAASASTSSRDVTDSEWELLQDFKELLQEDKAQWRSTLRDRAQALRKIIAEVLAREGVSGVVPAERVSHIPPAPEHDLDSRPAPLDSVAALHRNKKVKSLDQTSADKPKKVK